MPNFDVFIEKKMFIITLLHFNNILLFYHHIGINHQSLIAINNIYIYKY